jgi:hypothetical protein
MTLILSGTDGLSDVDGTAATPAIRGTDANTGIFFGADIIGFAEGGAEIARFDSSGNLLVGDTVQAGSARFTLKQSTDSTIGGLAIVSADGNGAIISRLNDGGLTFRNGGAERARIDSSGNLLVGTTSAISKLTVQGASDIRITVNESGSSVRTDIISQTTQGQIGTVSNHPLDLITNGTGRARIDSSGNLLVGGPSQVGANERFSVQQTGSSRAAVLRNDAGANWDTVLVWNAATSGDNLFQQFSTEATVTIRGAISYNRTGGLTVYGTASDYRAKDISGPVTNSGALIDSVPVYIGKMKGATQERPMFIAHETPAYAHTGVKDAVDADGNPVYQQMDASALIPVMWAEIQSLRQRLATLESA